MATIVLNDAYVSFGTAGDISTDCKNVSIDYEAEVVDDTVFGDTTRSGKGGLKNWSMTATVVNDFAASAIDSKIFGLVGTTGTIAIRPTSAAKGGSNPEFTGTALLVSYPILGQSVGDLVESPLQFRSAGTLSRATS